jgi:hypothetical protein
MKLQIIFASAILMGLVAGNSQGADIIVAAANSPTEAKARADIICDGTGDQIKLLASFTRAGRTKTVYERNPRTLLPTECYAGHSVEWLAGDYFLDDTLVIPDAEDCAIQAEGARFHYLPASGDAVVLTGLNRCRFHLGTIFSGSTGAALRVKPTTNMPSLMSIVGFTGLIGTGQKGIGLCVDSSVENVCTMRFEGTDIRGFDIGVFVPDARPASPDKPGSGKTDTDWYWLDYVRMCHTCIREERNGIDSACWFVNVDASISNAVAIRTAGSFGRWFVMMGTADWQARSHQSNRTRSIILDPGANNNVIEVTPPLPLFAPAENNSGNDSNIILCTNRPMTLPRIP